MFSPNTQPLPIRSQNLISQTSGFPEILILLHQQARTKQFPNRCHRYDIFSLKALKRLSHAMVVTQCINFCRNSIIQKLFQKIIQRKIVFLKCSVNSARFANTRIFPDKNFAHTFALLFIPVPPCCFFSSLSPKLT